MHLDHDTILLLSSVAGILVLAGITGWLLSRRAMSPGAKAVIANLNARTRS